MRRNWENWDSIKMPDIRVHIPVLLKEVLELLDPQEGQTFIDGTVNGGGHARAIESRVGAAGKVIGIDWDCDLIKESGIRNQELGVTNISLICDNYVNIREIAEEQGAGGVDGILFDLGFSSHHVDRAGRGFSFLRDEPLDMRYNTHDNDLTASKIVNAWPEKRIADILWRYGEERWARRIARGISGARARKEIVSSKELSEIIARSVPLVAVTRARVHPVRSQTAMASAVSPIARRTSNGMHPATRTFQALRIAVNREIESLERVLPEAVSLLAPGGRLAVISFHSLEDRIVKTFFKEQEKKNMLRIVTQKPIRPTEEEIRINPRARSARLRGAIKIWRH